MDVSGEFISATGVYSFAPAIGTAHGLYKAAPRLMPERVTEIVEQHPIPMVLHGGTGLSEDQFTDLIARGCAKVNISTALKIALVDASREYLEANPGKHDPPSLFKAQRTAIKDMAARHIANLRVGREKPRGHADLRLRRCPGRHRARRASPGLQRAVRGGRPAGRLVGGRIRGEAQDRWRQGADGLAADRRVRAREPTFPRTKTESCSPAGTSARRRSTSRLCARVGCRGGRGSRGSLRRRARRAGRSRWRPRRPRSRCGRCSSTRSVRSWLLPSLSSRVTSSPPRSPIRRSICSRWTSWAWRATT